MSALICIVKDHDWQEEPYPLELGPYDQTARFWALANGQTVYEVCRRCKATRWRSPDKPRYAMSNRSDGA